MARRPKVKSIEMAAGYKNPVVPVKTKSAVVAKKVKVKR